MAFSRRLVLNSWDRTEVSLPFGHGALVVGNPIHVSTNPDPDALERHRAALETALNTATQQARAIVGREH